MISETPEGHCPLLAADIAMFFDVELVNIRDNHDTWLFLLSSEA